jgi:hypothetical protein
MLKWTSFLEKLSELRKEENPDLKFLIFTEFTATQFMLKKILEEREGTIASILMVHGIRGSGWKP